MDTGIVVNVIALGFSAIAVLTSTILALRQSRLMHHANLLPTVTEVFREFNTPEFKDDLSYVCTDLWKEHPPTVAFDDLPDKPRHRVARVADYFFTIGVLVSTGVVSEVIVAGYMGRSILRAWGFLEPYIAFERTRRPDEHYYMFFENLAVVMTKNSPAKLNKRFKLARMPGNVVAPTLRSVDSQDQRT
jgi:hypothetical protein